MGIHEDLLIIMVRLLQAFFYGPHGADIRPHSQCQIEVFFPNLKNKFPIEKNKHILIKINQINIELESCKTCSSSLKYDVYKSNWLRLGFFYARHLLHNQQWVLSEGDIGYDYAWVSDNRGFSTTIFILSVWLFIC